MRLGQCRRGPQGPSERAGAVPRERGAGVPSPVAEAPQEAPGAAPGARAPLPAHAALFTAVANATPPALPRAATPRKAPPRVAMAMGLVVRGRDRSGTWPRARPGRVALGSPRVARQTGVARLPALRPLIVKTAGSSLTWCMHASVHINTCMYTCVYVNTYV